MNDDLRDMISREASHRRAARAYSRKLGMLTLRDAGLQALFAGHDDARGSRPRDGAGRRR